MKSFATKSVLSLVLLTLIALSGSALAIGGLSNDRAVEAQEAAKIRLEGAKLKACENREKAINNILDRLAKRGERRLNVYSTIADRVQAFYEKKGLSLSNYDALLADVNDKKVAAQAAVDEIKAADDVDFACDGTDPKGAVAGFKEDLKAEINALHAYQQSIKDLIVAIKTSISSLNQTNGGSGEGEE
ncbi:hypothetical protein HYU82_02850 [Candidatus Saccharibacteria bacterium]|nr:hypothetical protein [Candidatus Saccharibacteria bacterium]MBI2285736.1 hypothetical protein [Candidatus Saccharibacteria bacterium]